MRRHIVREEAEGEIFSRMTEEQWAELQAEANADEGRIAESMRERGIAEMLPFRVRRGKNGRPLPPRDDTWTGMPDEELFEYVREQDLYRFYAMFSNDLHANAGGLGALLREVNRGIANLSDREEVVP